MGDAAGLTQRFASLSSAQAKGLPRGGYSSLVGVNAADGALEIAFNSLLEVFKVLSCGGATAADLGPKIRLLL